MTNANTPMDLLLQILSFEPTDVIATITYDMHGVILYNPQWWKGMTRSEQREGVMRELTRLTADYLPKD